MSRTEMYTVNAAGDVEHFREFQNSHGSAAAVWSLLCVALLGESDFSWLNGDGPLNRLYALANDPDSAVDATDRAVLLATADMVVCQREHMAALAERFDAFHDRYAEKRKGYVFSIGEQASAIREALADESVRGVCWNQTSVNCSPWWVRSERDEEADEEEERMYNIDRDKSHWVLTLADGLWATTREVAAEHDA